ncbi:MAG: M28 family peptidase [Oscillospiraceae bacterium]|nr:M28 family peptidase [Oscillospiraceae bacterium]
MSKQFELLKKIGFVRVGGSAEELKAAQILKAEVEAMGIKADIEPFEIEDYVQEVAELEVLEPYNKKYIVRAYRFSENTPDEGIEAPFYYAENMTDVDIANSKGKIILVNGIVRLDLFRKILKSGAVGFISMTGTMLDTDENSDLLQRSTRDTLRAFGNLPAASIRIKDAFEMVKEGASKVKLTVKGQFVTRTSHNVVATIPGTDKADEIVSFGAHFDSVEFSTGVYDNGAGSVINMEILRHFVANPPRRTLQFNWYGSEEMGLLGSKAWVKAHKDELKDHVYMINVDVGGSVLGADQALVLASKEAANYCDSFMRRKGYAVITKQDIYSSDGVPFADNGVPSTSFIRFGTQGAGYIHDRNDIIDWLYPKALERTTKFVQDYAEEMINADVFPFAKVVPPEMTEKVDNYLFKKEMAEAAKLKENK